MQQWIARAGTGTAALVVGLWAVVPAGPAAADFGAQTQVLDDRARSGRSVSIDLGGPRVITPTKFGHLEGTVARRPGDGALAAAGVWADAARQAARRHNIPEGLFLELVRAESNFDPAARSHKGAIGLAQLMPATAADLGVDPHDPHQNLDGGARYLRMMQDRFGTWRLALAAYNAGPGAVEAHGGVPPFAETRAYVRAILGR